MTTKRLDIMVETINDVLGKTRITLELTSLNGKQITLVKSKDSIVVKIDPRRCCPGQMPFIVLHKVVRHFTYKMNEILPTKSRVLQEYHKRVVNL